MPEIPGCLLHQHEPETGSEITSTNKSSSSQTPEITFGYVNGYLKTSQLSQMIKFFWDENLSPDVPRALQILDNSQDCKYAFVGDSSSYPRRGSPDQELINFAKTGHWVIVTSNNDLIEDCITASVNFVWLSQRRRQTLTKIEQVLLVLSQIKSWKQFLTESNSPIFIFAQKTKCEILTSEQINSKIRNSRRAMRRTVLNKL